ncbi:MAG TPA: MBL fold metallo-hydrolase [Syntrophales bacterium]|nr:MBL fold metallo-hydrolase [Syntrophales bacterium]
MFSAHLINDPFGDPGVYVEFKHKRRALLFDLGDLHNLSPRKLLKIDHIFVSHTHMDHFIGFDYLLRVCLGRDCHISIFGPPGFHSQIENKIQAYTWNLVENYTNDFALHVTEVHPERKLKRTYHCRTAFMPEIDNTDEVMTGSLVEDSSFAIRAEFLDHKIPCLAYTFEEKSRVNIKKNILLEMGLPVGAWLMDLKDRILRGEPDDTPVRVWWKAGKQDGGERFIPLGELKETIVKMTPGQKVTYITDTVYSEDNARKIVELASSSDLMFVEATFLHEDADKAAEKHHLTAFQAGTLARRAGAKRITLFHFSPKYKGAADLLVEEAMAAFSGSEP